MSGCPASVFTAIPVCSGFSIDYYGSCETMSICRIPTHGFRFLHLAIHRLAFRVVGYDFRHLPLSCGCLSSKYRTITQHPNVIIGRHLALSTLYARGFDCPCSGYRFRQFSYYPHTRIFVLEHRDRKSFDHCSPRLTSKATTCYTPRLVSLSDKSQDDRLAAFAA